MKPFTPTTNFRGLARQVRTAEAKLFLMGAANLRCLEERANRLNPQSMSNSERKKAFGRWQELSSVRHRVLLEMRYGKKTLEDVQRIEEQMRNEYGGRINQDEPKEPPQEWTHAAAQW